jgi:hypothetical protein
MSLRTITILAQITVTSLFASMWWYLSHIIFGQDTSVEIQPLAILATFGFYYVIIFITYTVLQSNGVVTSDIKNIAVLILTAIFLSVGPWLINLVFGTNNAFVDQSNILEVMIYRVKATTPFFSGAIAALAFHKHLFNPSTENEALETI